MMDKAPICAAAMLVAASAATAAPGRAAEVSDEVRVESGLLKGALAGNVLSFKGVPFAAPPVGPLRWRAPQAAPRWSGVRPATSYGHDCAQLPFPSDAAPLGTEPSEDCLVLNVWRPARATSAKLPVMVWIYGGGFVNGGSSPAVYDGGAFARQGVVFVSFNYRVGRFGFFAHPALSKSVPAGEPLGNYGYMDQIAALRWVQRNIASFGGDPKNVTVFGESAGGASVHTLLASPMARGLFHKAAIESGGGRGSLMGPRRVHEDQPGLPSGESVGVTFARANGIEGDGPEALAALRALPTEKVVAGLNIASMGQAQGTYAGPMLDGRIAIEAPDQAYRAGRGAKVPVLVGANSADIGFPSAPTLDEVFAAFGPRAAEARRRYDPQSTNDFRSVAARVAMDRSMIEPARLTAELYARQGLPAYAYRFSYVASAMRAEWPTGAPHATEIPYVFDTVKVKYGGDLTQEDAAVARLANTYWANFAKTGNPNGPGLPAWPAYEPAKDVIMDFASGGAKAGPDPWKARLDLTAAAAGTATP